MMTKGFRFLEDIALADLAFEAWGESPSELFASAAEALMEAKKGSSLFHNVLICSILLPCLAPPAFNIRTLEFK